jgi:hypothetical protein
MCLKGFESITATKENNTTEVLSFSLAGVAGFEPANGGTKSRCLTTWRYPKI